MNHKRVYMLFFKVHSHQISLSSSQFPGKAWHSTGLHDIKKIISIQMPSLTYIGTEVSSVKSLFWEIWVSGSRGWLFLLGHSLERKGSSDFPP